MTPTSLDLHASSVSEGKVPTCVIKVADRPYPYQFDVVRRGWFWFVVANPGNYHAAGPFWSETTALRVRGGLTQWFRTGHDIGSGRWPTQRS